LDAVRRNLSFSLRLLLLLTAVSVLASPIAIVAAEPVVQEAAASHEPGAAEGEHHDVGWGPTFAKLLNFGVLAGVLVYFLKTPIAGYLKGRSETIRRDLVDAAALRANAERQLVEVRERLARLPAEIEGLRQRGSDELAQERLRIAEDATRERDLLLERTRREIETQLRFARRELIAHVADLSMKIARAKIEREITPDDQARLIERYVAEVRA
jgi:F-type H+-transporting ATPase subunit b